MIMYSDQPRAPTVPITDTINPSNHSNPCNRAALCCPPYQPAGVVTWPGRRSHWPLLLPRVVARRGGPCRAAPPSGWEGQRSRCRSPRGWREGGVVRGEGLRPAVPRVTGGRRGASGPWWRHAVPGSRCSVRARKGSKCRDLPSLPQHPGTQ